MFFYLLMLRRYINISQILSKYELFFSDWLLYAQKINLDIFLTNKVKSLFFLTFEEIKNCTMNNNHKKVLKKFLNDQPKWL